MSKQQLNVRISESTRDKLDRLTRRHGTQTEAVAVAIHNLYEKEKTMATIFGHDLNSRMGKMVLIAHRLTILEAAAEETEVFSASLQAAILGTIRMLPLGGDNYWINAAGATVGHGQINQTSTYDPEFAFAGALLERAKRLSQRNRELPSHPKPDPIFEIIRHIKNTWYGRRASNAYPNEIAQRIMEKYPYRP